MLLVRFDKLLLISKLKNQEIILLNFHRINPEVDLLWPSMHPKNFEKLIIKLKKNVNIISIQKIFSNSLFFNKKPNVIISFDDGYKDFLDHALPILKKHKIHSHMNICPGLIDDKKIPWTQIVNLSLINNDKKFLNLLDKFNIKYHAKINEPEFISICNSIISLKNNNYIKFIDEVYNLKNNYENLLMKWDDINKCISNNVLIGSHSMYHINLDKNILKERRNLEITESKKIIEKKTNKAVEIFALPNGTYDKDIINELKKSYKYILLCEDKNIILKEKKDNYVLARINISQNDYREEYLRSIGFHQFVKKIIYKKNYIYNE